MASKLSFLGFENVDIRRFDQDVVQRIDVVPELTSLLFSYYDGEQWHSSWSFSQRRRLPVAVEMRFDLAKRASIKESPNPDPSDAAQRLLRAGNKTPVALERPMDDRLRSSQTAAPVGYRWLIYLGGHQDLDSGLVKDEVFARRDSMP